MSQNHSTRLRRRRRAVITALAFAMVAVLVPTIGANPAGAAPAPLLTPNGLGVRIDENALLGAPLEAIETALQPTIDNLIYQGGVDSAPLSDYEWLDVDSNLELGLDFLAPSAGRPYGGLTVNASIQGIDLEYRADPSWPFADCSIWVRPDNASITATAKVDPTRLPNAPVTIEPVQATWDDDPSVSTSGVCWWYLIDDLFEGWWNDLIGNDPQSTASRIAAQVNAIAQDLVDDMWAQYVVPVLADLNAFGISFSDIHTDTNGLIVKANVDATNGLTIPTIGGPYNVSAAVDSGATSNVDTLLAQRGGDVIVSIHPNVVNQFINALYQVQNGNIAGFGVLDGPAVEAYLLPVANRATYNDAQWTVAMATTSTFYTEPTGAGGAPQLKVPAARWRFSHPANFFGLQPVATFNGTISGVDLITEIRSFGDAWGPALNGNNLSVSATLSTTPGQTIAAVVSWNPSPAGLVPYTKTGIASYNQTWLVDNLSLAPIEIAGFDIALCTGCGRYSGDQRYTETFNVV